MAVTEDEAAASGAGAAQRQNPIPNSNPNQNPNTNPNPNSNENPNPNPPHTTKGSKGKSCKGCTYYTSLHKIKSKNPTCVGFSRTLQQGRSLLVYNSFFWWLVRLLKKSISFKTERA